jgi:hypothetical protein
MGLLHIVGLKSCICQHFYDGWFNKSMQVLQVMYIGIISILYHDLGIVMGIPSHSVNFKGVV